MPPSGSQGCLYIVRWDAYEPFDQYDFMYDGYEPSKAVEEASRS